MFCEYLWPPQNTHFLWLFLHFFWFVVTLHIARKLLFMVSFNSWYFKTFTQVFVVWPTFTFTKLILTYGYFFEANGYQADQNTNRHFEELHVWISVQIIHHNNPQSSIHSVFLFGDGLSVLLLLLPPKSLSFQTYTQYLPCATTGRRCDINAFIFCPISTNFPTAAQRNTFKKKLNQLVFLAPWQQTHPSQAVFVLPTGLFS